MKDYEMSIKEYLLAILHRWKSIFLLAFVGALALGAGSFLGQTSSISQQTAEFEKQSSINQQSIDEKLQLIDMLAEKVSSIDDYLDRSILMQTDPYNKQIAAITLSIDVQLDSINFSAITENYDGAADIASAKTNNVLNHYLVLIENANLSEVLEGVLPRQYSESHLREAVRVKKNAQGIITISCVGNSVVDAVKIVDAMYEYLLGRQEMVSQMTGAHSIAVLDRSNKQVADSTLAEVQADQLKQKTEIENQIKALNLEIADMQIEKPREGISRTVLMRQAVLGLLAGGFIGLVLALVRFLSVLPVQIPEQIQERLGVRYLGGVKRRVRDPFAKLAASIRGSFLLEEEGAALQLISANMREVIGEHKKVLLTGSLTEKENAEFAHKLAQLPTLKGVELVPAANVNKSADAVRKLGETSGVILIERLLTSKMEDVQREKNRIDVSGKEILGYVLY